MFRVCIILAHCTRRQRRYHCGNDMRDLTFTCDHRELPHLYCNADFQLIYFYLLLFHTLSKELIFSLLNAHFDDYLLYMCICIYMSIYIYIYVCVYIHTCINGSVFPLNHPNFQINHYTNLTH